VVRQFGRGLHLDALERPTDEASEKPVHQSDDDESLFLASRKMPSKNVYQGDYSAHYPYRNPPDDPAVNPHMNVIHKILPTM
jgi:hypothetical protein